LRVRNISTAYSKHISPFYIEDLHFTTTKQFVAQLNTECESIRIFITLKHKKGLFGFPNTRCSLSVFTFFLQKVHFLFPCKILLSTFFLETGKFNFELFILRKNISCTLDFHNSYALLNFC